MLILFTGLVSFSSCMTFMMGVRKPIVMDDATRDLVVTSNGDTYKMKNVTAFSSSGGNTTTIYKYPGVNMNTRNHTQLELQYGNQTATVPIVNKHGIGWLVVEGIFTLGIATAIDLATGANCRPTEMFIDVPAYLDHTTPRSHKELTKTVWDSFK